MKAIVTKFHGQTDTKPSRVSATAEGVGRIYVTGNDHDAAARALAVKYGWTGTYHRGALPDGTGYAYVNAEEAFKV